MVGKDIRAKLNYTQDEGPGKRPYFYAYPPGEEEKKERGHTTQFSGGNAEVEVTVRDARNHPELSLDKNSFQLYECETKLETEEFYTDLDKVKEVYYKEIEELFKKATGAEHAVVFHHQVRDIERNNASADTGVQSTVQPYAFGIHSDSHPMSAKDLFKNFVPSLDPKYQKGRFLYINAWRNISDTPIVNNTLAVLDETSTVKPDDYIVSDFFDRIVSIQQFKLLDSNSDRHKWYYYPDMKKNEVLLFKQWDSDPELSGRLCFHTAFNDPSAPATPSRKSVEARGIVFFPDHEPNTCPALSTAGKASDLSIPRATDVGRVKSKHVFNLPLNGVYEEEVAKIMEQAKGFMQPIIKSFEDAADNPEKFITNYRGLHNLYIMKLGSHSDSVEKCDTQVVYTTAEDDQKQVEITIYKPKALKGKKTAAIVFIHPGGPIVGGKVDMFAGFCSSIALACDMAVACVSYRSVKEVEFPGPVDDIYHALKHIANKADTLTIDSTKISLMGVGHGAYLLCSLMVKLAQQNESDLVKMALLIEPSALDDTGLRDPDILTYEEKPWVSATKGFFNALSCGHLEAKSSDPLFYPGKTEDELMLKFPPTVVFLSEFGKSITTGSKFARRLRNLGRLLELVIQPGASENMMAMPPSSQVYKQYEDIIKRAIQAYAIE